MSMAGYTKLFNSILASTIWREANHVRVVWITLLAMADKHGIAEGSVPGIADLARVSVEECRDAIARLQAPDPDSRTTESGGRRIEPVDGGFRLINHRKYREKLNADERREYLRLKQQEHRRKSTGVNKRNDLSTPSTQPEAAPTPEADPVRKERGADAPPSPQALVDLWNQETAPPIARCRGLSKGRAAQARQRLSERSLEEWRGVYRAVNQSPFLRGDNDRGWRASFDWILKPENVLKVLEGKYEATAASPRPSAADAKLPAWARKAKG